MEQEGCGCSTKFGSSGFRYIICNLSQIRYVKSNSLHTPMDALSGLDKRLAPTSVLEKWSKDKKIRLLLRGKHIFFK